MFKGSGVSRLALTAGKNGKIYVLNADNLGGYRQGTGQTDLTVQTIETNKPVFGGPGSYPLEGGYIYYTPIGYPTYAYKLGFDASGKPVFSLAGQSNEISAGRVGVGVPTVTTFKGKPGTGIVWNTDPNAGVRAWYAVPGPDGKLKSIQMPQIGGAVKFQRPSFGDTRFYTTDSNGVLYCIGSPVNLPLSCTSVDFGPVPIGSKSSATVNCTAIIALTAINGLTVGDPRFIVSNSTLPKGPVAKGASFSFPVTWDLTDTNVTNAQNASYGKVTPGIQSTPLTIYTTNAVAGYSSAFPLSLSGTEVSALPYLDVTPNDVDFGGLVLGVSGEDPSISSPFTISNLGQSPLKILGYAYTKNGPESEDGDGDDSDDSDSGPGWTNVTFSDGSANLGPGFDTTSLPAVGSVIGAQQSISVPTTFSAANGVGDYLSYFQVYSDGGNQYIILEGSASSAPVANFSISTSEGGWIDSTDLDFGSVAPGATATRQIRICNQGGSVLSITKSKPPLGIIRATSPGIDLHEGQSIPVNTCAYGTIVFAPLTEPPNVADFQVTNSWTLNVDGKDSVNLLFDLH